MSKLIDIIAGARPNFMKVSSIIRAMNQQADAPGALRYRLVHTGQHYDQAMSESFFEQLGIPSPDVNLEVGSGTQAEQTGGIMCRYESLLLENPCDLCLVVGDVTSTMACAITAQKLHIPVAHIEAGIRSDDWAMPEEINRLVTDSITNYFFTTSAFANQNLRAAGVQEDRIHFVGNTMIDTLLFNLDSLSPPDFYGDEGFQSGEYFVLTLHRPSNVDDAENLRRLLDHIAAGTRGLPVIFSVHPRTASVLEKIGNIPESFFMAGPQPYLQFNFLVKNAKAVITDSGGITEETTVMGVPCLTLRDSTERPETVEIGTNALIGTNPSAIPPALDRLFEGQWQKGGIPDLWDGKTGGRIVKILHGLLSPDGP